MRLTVYSKGEVVLTIPRGVGYFAAERFVSEKIFWIMEKLAAFSGAKTLPIKSGKKHYAENRREAKNLIERRTRELGQNLGYTYGRISIRNQKTRWGSCSKRGSLSFNYKIAFLPESVRDYIIVHELCHLKEFNHSKRFWDLVRNIIPDYKNIRKELRKYNVNLG